MSFHWWQWFAVGRGEGAWVVCKCGCAFLHPAPPHWLPAQRLVYRVGISSHSKSQLSVRSNGWALGPECGRETERRGHALQQGRGGCKGRRGGRHAGSAPTSTQNMSKRGRIDHGVAKKRRGSIGGCTIGLARGIEGQAGTGGVGTTQPKSRMRVGHRTGGSLRGARAAQQHRCTA